MRGALATEAYVAVAALVDRELGNSRVLGARRARMADDDDARVERDARVRALFAALLAARSAREDATPAEVCEGVWLGSVGAAAHGDALRARGVTHVLTVCDGVPPLDDDEEGGVKFTRATRAVRDAPDAPIEETFDFCFDFIADAVASGGAVLVHCFQGKSRSATICAMYMMRAFGASYDDAMTRIRAVRPCARPNSGFERRLRALEATLARDRASTAPRDADGARNDV